MIHIKSDYIKVKRMIYNYRNSVFKNNQIIVKGISNLKTNDNFYKFSDDGKLLTEINLDILKLDKEQLSNLSFKKYNLLEEYNMDFEAIILNIYQLLKDNSLPSTSAFAAIDFIKFENLIVDIFKSKLIAEKIIMKFMNNRSLIIIFNEKK